MLDSCEQELLDLLPDEAAPFEQREKRQQP
jgi:hypothetical protein